MLERDQRSAPQREENRAHARNRHCETIRSDGAEVFYTEVHQAAEASPILTIHSEVRTSHMAGERKTPHHFSSSSPRLAAHRLFSYSSHCCTSPLSTLQHQSSSRMHHTGLFLALSHDYRRECSTSPGRRETTPSGHLHQRTDS